MAGCLAPAESLEPRALLSAGDLDPSFGVGGKVTTEFREGTTTSVVARATALQADGKIVAAGEGGIARYMPNGSLEFTFGVSGRVEYPFAARSVAIQSDGKIVVGGGFGQYTSDDFVVSRYLSNGMPDTAFDGDGRFLRRFGTHRRDAANAVAIQADGRIVVTGLAQFDYASYVAVARYNTDGSTDTGFGQWGCKLLPTSTVTNGQNPGGGKSRSCSQMENC